jgi:ribosomal protein L34
MTKQIKIEKRKISTFMDRMKATANGRKVLA